jgi:hypothetical protein
MYTIAAKHARSGMVRCRPPYGGRGGAGSKGSTIAHSWSGTRSSTRLAMDGSLPYPAERAKRRLSLLGLAYSDDSIISYGYYALILSIKR